MHKIGLNISQVGTKVQKVNIVIILMTLQTEQSPPEKKIAKQVQQARCAMFSYG